LLSISVLSIFDTNKYKGRTTGWYVVICFQFQFFLSLIPTTQDIRFNRFKLWFAFNFSSFYLWYQHIRLSKACIARCDLLSISVLSIFDTNIIADTFLKTWLWFAFNFSSFYLWYQLLTAAFTQLISCDLLSISVLSIFDTNMAIIILL